MNNPSVTACSVRVTGRVQGVWFRKNTRQQALRRALSGWVKNQPDGSVSAHLQGDPEQIEDLLTWLQNGPPLARVDLLEVTTADLIELNTFEIR